MVETVAPGKWVGFDWVLDHETAADINYWKWAAGFFQRLSERSDVATIRRRPSHQPAETVIPLEHRHPPMPLAEAGIQLGLAPATGDRPHRREAAAKAVRRLIDAGHLDVMPTASPKKWIFSRLQVPEA